MIWKVVLVLSLALCVISDKPAISKQKIKRFYTGHHGDLSHIGEHKPEHHEVYASAYPSYEYSYHVDDPHTHDSKAQQEVRDGDVVTGSYWFIQPDGYKRVVKYRSDKKSGFEAEVNYIPVEKYFVKKGHHEKREHKEEHKAAESHDVKFERRHQVHNENRKRDHHRDVLKNQEKQKEEPHVYHHEGREHHIKHEDKEEFIPQIHRHEIRKSHERKEEHRPYVPRHEIKEHHSERRHKEVPVYLQKAERKIHHDIYNENHNQDYVKPGHSRDLRRGDDDHQAEHFWRGSYGKDKEVEDHKSNQHLEHAKHDNWGWKRGRNEEHWKDGRLVGWREGRVSTRSYLDTRDRKGEPHNSRTNEEHYEDRRGQHSSLKPITNFKPIIPYGQRLH